MLTLKLTPSEFRDLIYFLRMCTRGQQAVPLHQQSVAQLVLLDYHNRITATNRLLTWQRRSASKYYRCSLPLAVSKALHDQMQCYLLCPLEQILLDRLDQAIVNYQDPYAQPHVLGELVRSNHYQTRLNQQ